MKDIIIIGAGVSGLAAGQQLLEKGFNVKIFDALDRVGGRINKLTDIADFPIEQGGEELYNSKGRYYQLCKKAGAKIIPRNDPQTYIEHPKEKRFMRIDEFSEKYPKEANVLDTMREFSFQNVDQNMNVDKAWDVLKLDPQFKFWGQECLGTENGGDWNTVALKQLMIKDVIFPTFNDVYLLANMSHWDVIQKSFPDAIKKVQLNTEIKEINHTNPDKIILTTTNGQVYKSDIIIYTPCVKILQNRAMKFVPDLPQWKYKAIDEIGIEPMGKLFIKFSEPIFDPEMFVMYFDYHATYGWVSSQGRTLKNDYVISFLIAQDTCALVDKDQQKFIDGLLSHLQKFSKVKDIKGKVQKVHWKNWGAERLIIGGHSYDSLKTKPDSRKQYSKNIDERIFFSGEAANFENRHGAINGAIDHGFTVANEIFELASKKKINQNSKL